MALLDGSASLTFGSGDFPDGTTWNPSGAVPGALDSVVIRNSDIVLSDRIRSMPCISQSNKAEYIELSFDLDNIRSDHFLVPVFVELKNENGVIRRPAFYDGGQTWKARFNPPIGTYDVRVYEGGALVDLPMTRVVQNKTTDRSYIRLHPTKQQRFIKGDEPFFAIGVNGCYKGSYEIDFPNKPISLEVYRRTFEKMQEHGFNTFRFLLSYERRSLFDRWMPDEVNREQLRKGGNGLKPGEFDLQTAAFLDGIVELATQYNIELMLVTDHRGLVTHTLPQAYRSNKPGQQQAFDKVWGMSTWNKRNGGIISSPKEVFTNKRAIEIYDARNRYLIARYGWSPNLFAIEMCAESYLWSISRENPSLFASWQHDRYDYMKSIDPNHHLICTGDGDNMGSNVSFVDFYAPHVHPSSRKRSIISEAGQGKDYAIANHFDHPKTAYVDLNKKTVLIGALGYGQLISETTGKKSKEYFNIRVHDDRHLLWESLMNGSAGVGFPWDEKGAIPHYGGFRIYGPMVTFINEARIGEFEWKPVASLKMSLSGCFGHGMICEDDDRSVAFVYNTSDIFKTVTASRRNSGSVDVPVDFNGSAKVKYIDAATGEITETKLATASGGKVRCSVDFKRDLAILVTKN